jgi:CHAD domain-containing protein
MVGFFKGVPEISSEPKAMKRLLRSLKNLQGRLGEIHDGEAKAKFLEAEARNLPGGASHIAAFAAGTLAAPPDTSAQLAEALDAYKKLANAKPF